MATVERVFLGWDRPGPDAAADWLCSFAHDGELDLSDRVVVTAGRRAARVISSILAQRCEANRTVLSQPRWITPGEICDVLNERLDRNAKRSATEEMRQLAYVRALDEAGSEFVKPLAGRYDPRAGLSVRMNVASGILAVQDELARELMRFADAIESAQRFPGFDAEEERWKVASSIQDRYETILARWGCADDHLLNIHRLHDGNQQRSAAKLTLIGIVELPKVARSTIELRASSLTVAILAPESEESGFDELGCLVLPRWSTDRFVGLEADQVIIAESAREQARAVFGLISELGANVTGQDIAIGVPDDNVVPMLEFESELTDSANVRSAAGTPFRNTAPGRLLEALSGYLEDRSWKSLASLVRTPEVSGIIVQPIKGADPIHVITEEWRTRLSREVDVDLLSGIAKEIVTGIDRWIKPLAQCGSSDFKQLSMGLMEVLRSAYGTLRPDEGTRARRMSFESCMKIHGAVTKLFSLPSSDVAICTPSEFLRVIAAMCRSESISERQDDDAIEMLGWLELLHDPARHVFVTGMNEGYVPQSRDADPMLPNGLREHLGLPHDRARLARDLFVLHALKNSRATIRLIAGRRAFDGSPLKPSRLLLSESPEIVVARLAEYSRFEASKLPAIRVAERIVKPGGENRFRCCPLGETAALNELPVTAFKEYITSPYLFYLKYVLRLKEREDPTPELDAMAFGTLLHETLNDFGKSDLSETADAGKITAFLTDQLSTKCEIRFGARPTGAVRLQLESARLRLGCFAKLQAERRSEGWRIIETEWESDHASMETPDGPFGLKGRIDRIDQHERSGRIAIWDYKSGDQAVDPLKDHGNPTKGIWKNLQLPLYRHLALALGKYSLMDPVDFGYVLLPRSAEATAFKTAGWDLSSLAAADEKARQVIDSVRGLRFQDLGRAKPGDAALAGICGIGQLGMRPPMDDEESEGGE